MFGNGRVKKIKATESGKGLEASKSLIMKTEMFTATKAVESGLATEAAKADGGDFGWSPTYEAPDGSTHKKLNPKFYGPNHKTGDTPLDKLDAKETYFCTYDLAVDGSVIEISATSFPGTLTNRAPLWDNTNQFGELLKAVA